MLPTSNKRLYKRPSRHIGLYQLAKRPGFVACNGRQLCRMRGPAGRPTPWLAPARASWQLGRRRASVECGKLAERAYLDTRCANNGLAMYDLLHIYIYNGWANTWKIAPERCSETALAETTGRCFNMCTLACA